ncbi:MAG: hypothetical protein ACOX8U_05975 [Bradymonadia bacterium]
MYRVILFSFVAAIGILHLGACVVGETEQSNAPIETQTGTIIDSDSSKEKALGLIFGMPQIDDRLDVNAGDMEDWRYIIVPEAGQMSISINIDTPGTIQGGWSIYDYNERTLITESFNPNQSFYQLKSVPVEKGIYYFKTYAVSGKSIYTIGTQYTANPTQPVIAEIEEPEVEEPVARPRRPRKTTRTPAKTESRPTPPPKAGAKTVKGFISIITPQTDGSAKITIRNAGTKFGVNTGDVGYIENGGLKIETTDCRATSCIAIIPERANPKALKENSNVIFTIK